MVLPFLPLFWPKNYTLCYEIITLIFRSSRDPLNVLTWPLKNLNWAMPTTWRRSWFRHCIESIPQFRTTLQGVRLFISNVLCVHYYYMRAPHLHPGGFGMTVQPRCWILHVFHQRTMFLSLKKPRQSKTKWGGTLKKKNWTHFWCSIFLAARVANDLKTNIIKLGF